MSKLKLAALMFLNAVALVLLSGGFAGMSAAAQGGPCVAKTCTVDGIDGVCCQMIPGAIACSPCGGFEPE